MLMFAQIYMYACIYPMPVVADARIGDVDAILVTAGSDFCGHVMIAAIAVASMRAGLSPQEQSSTPTRPTPLLSQRLKLMSEPSSTPDS